jgi:hypothetical protein
VFLFFLLLYYLLEDLMIQNVAAVACLVSVFLIYGLVLVNVVDASEVVAVYCGHNNTYGPHLDVDTTLVLRYCGSPNGTNITILLNESSGALAGLSIFVEHCSRVSVAVTTASATANVSNLTVVLRNVTEDVGTPVTPLPTPLLQILDIGSLLSSMISISDVTFRRDREMVLLRNVSESIVRTTLVLSHVTSSSYFPIVMCDTVAKSFLNCALILVNVSRRLRALQVRL